MSTTYIDGIEAHLPERYDTDVFLVGRINGALDALSHLNNHTNHVPSFGFLEIEVGERAPITALREWYSHLPSPLSALVVEDWQRALRDGLRRVAVEECEPLQSLKPALFGLVDDLVDRFVELFRDDSLEVLAMAAGGQGLHGYISDDSLAFVAGKKRLYVLALGWTD